MKKDVVKQNLQRHVLKCYEKNNGLLSIQTEFPISSFQVVSVSELSKRAGMTFKVERLTTGVLRNPATEVYVAASPAGPRHFRYATPRIVH